MNYYSKNIRFLAAQEHETVEKLRQKLGVKSIESPSLDELIKLQDFFKVSIDELVFKNLTYGSELKGKIKFLLLDVDGTMTDGGMYFTENGDQFKKYNTKDGMAIKGLTKKGFQVGIISHGYKLHVVKSRADLLGIQNVYVGQEPKTDILANWCSELGIGFNEVAYIGDDINDLEIMRIVGVGACPKDAVKEVKEVADIILKHKGGKACVREFIDEYVGF